MAELLLKKVLSAHVHQLDGGRLVIKIARGHVGAGETSMIRHTSSLIFLASKHISHLRAFNSDLSVLRSMSSTNSKARENVWDYPRPPALERTNRLLEVKWVFPDGREVPVAATREAYRVLETSHPPTYYLPPSSIDSGHAKLKVETGKRSFCEWKGVAEYHTLEIASSSGSPSASVASRIWSYPSPTTRFVPIKDYLSFYASTGSSNKGSEGYWKCSVDGEDVKAQDGDFYGGWITSDIHGGPKGIKGAPGTYGW